MLNFYLYSIIISKKKCFLFYSNSKSLFIFIKLKININFNYKSVKENHEIKLMTCLKLLYKLLVKENISSIKRVYIFNII